MLLLYVIAAAVFVAGAVELGARALELAPLEIRYPNNIPDPVLPFRPKPGFRHIYRSPEFVHEERHNSMGYRDVEHRRNKPAGTFRILALGDSLTWGAGAAFEETFLVRLEQMLNARTGRHPPVEIIKAGIYAFFPEPERLLLEHEGLAFQPDLVMVVFFPNDVQETALGLEAITVTQQGYLMTAEARDLGRVGLWLYMHSEAARVVLRGVVSRALLRRLPGPAEDIYSPDGSYEAAWRAAEGELKKMIDLAAAHQARMVLVYIPEKNLDQPGADYPPQRLAQLCTDGGDKGAEFINLLPALRRARAANPDQPLYWPLDGHCTPAGYRVIAETLFEELTRRGLVP
ncbi:MAG: hypothetical protein Kow0059_12200 [Candidatus Sumerlaeia bacterium]